MPCELLWLSTWLSLSNSALRTGAVDLWGVLSLRVNYSPNSWKKGHWWLLTPLQCFLLMRVSGSLLNTLVLVVANFRAYLPCLGRGQHPSVWQACLTVNSTNGVEHSSFQYQAAGIQHSNIQMSNRMVLVLKTPRVWREFLSPGWWCLNPKHSVWPLWTVS